MPATLLGEKDRLAAAGVALGQIGSGYGKAAKMLHGQQGALTRQATGELMTPTDRIYDEALARSDYQRSANAALEPYLRSLQASGVRTSGTGMNNPLTQQIARGGADLELGLQADAERLRPQNILSALGAEESFLGSRASAVRDANALRMQGVLGAGNLALAQDQQNQMQKGQSIGGKMLGGLGAGLGAGMAGLGKDLVPGMSYAALFGGG